MARGWFRVQQWFRQTFDNARNSLEQAISSFNETGGVGSFDSIGLQVQSDALARKAREDAQRHMELQAELQRQIELEAEAKNRPGGHATQRLEEDVPGGGFEEDGLRPQPSPSSYAGSVPSNQVQGESGLWIIRGDWKLVQGCNNAYAIRYDIDNGSLFVQYKHWAPPMEIGSQNGPGPVYEYTNVSIPEAHSCFNAKNVDDWIWEHLRVRGTWSLHQKPYRIVSVSHGYLPRKATWNYRNTGQEWFVQRQMWSANGMAAYSQLPTAPAPNRGIPGRGAPNRGRPNNGKPQY